MRRLVPAALLAATLLAALPAIHPASLPAQQQEPQALFDGQTLTGWRGDPRLWRVEDGCLVGSTQGQPIPQNSFLVWQGGELADFELSLEVRMLGDNNSGIQYRSAALPSQPFALAGYQCDVHPQVDYLAMLYEERGGGILARQGQFVGRDLGGALRPLGTLAVPSPQALGEWQRLRIVARGNLVWHELNGRTVTALHDDAATARRSGLLGLQLHSGAPMTVWFRNLLLRQLPREELAMPPLLTALLERDRRRLPQTPPRWIWSQQVADGQEVFFRRRFAVAAVPERSELIASCDNHCRIYLNGKLVLQHDRWETPARADVTAHLRAGDNLLVVHGSNDGGPAGLALALRWQLAGQPGELLSDAQFRCHDDDPDGWDRLDFDDSGWAKARELAVVGAAGAPWSGSVQASQFATEPPPETPQLALPAEGLSGPLARGALELLAVPRAYGSWVCLAADPSGRLYASDQARWLYRITPARALGEETTIERVPVDLDGCQGLCWFRDSLYAVVNGRRSGLYRLSDRDGDGMLEHVELLRALRGNGEHGPHAVAPTADGEALWVLCGNHTDLPELAASRLPRVWADDRLPKKIEDPNGHAVGVPAPGGFLCRVDPDGQRWELWAAGFRNSYDLAVLPNGDVLTYDSDMEWDMGLPWYRPTRVYLAQSGSDQGWRSGSSKWPPHSLDAPPPVYDLGPGSPTGVVADGRRLLLLDWTFGTVHALDLTPADGSYAASHQEVLHGVPLPVADLVIHERRGYLLTGGRGLPSRLYALELDAAEPLPAADALLQQRQRLESMHAGGQAWDQAAVLAALAGPPALQLAARLAVEAQPLANWREQALAEPPGQPQLWLLYALARHGAAADQQALLEALLPYSWPAMPKTQQLLWLRVLELALLRLPPPAAELRERLAQRLLPQLPSGDDSVDAALAEVLAALDAPGLLDRAVPLLQPLRPATPPAWAVLASRNERYGAPIERMLANMPPTGQIALANALRAVDAGWTLAQRETQLRFLLEARERRGGASYNGYLKAFVDAAYAQCSPAEQVALAELAGKAKAELPAFRATPPRGPGRQWTLASAKQALPAGLAGADLQSGHNLFHAASCASCHYYAGEGGNHGPDLTSLGNKFTVDDLLVAILEPSRDLSDQYAGMVLRLRDGSQLAGQVRQRQTADGEVYEVMPAVAHSSLQRIPAAQVLQVEPSKLSPMPAGLVDGLNADELRDLLAFLLARGRR